MGDSFKVETSVEVPLEVAVRAVISGVEGLKTPDVARVAAAANAVLASRGVNVPGISSSDSADRLGRDPGFNVADVEGARRRAALKEQLVGSSYVGVKAQSVLFEGALSRSGGRDAVGINVYRSANGRDLVPTVSEVEFRKYADRALSDEVLNTVEAVALPQTANRPLLFIPDVPHLVEGTEFTVEEAVRLFVVAGKYNGVELSDWDGREEFLRQYSVDELVNARTGDHVESGSIGGVVIPTAYDSKRAGTYRKQHDDLEALQSDHEGVTDARLYHGAVLACTDVNVPIDSDVSYVRAVGLDAKRISGDSASGVLFVPSADVHKDNAFVDGSSADPFFDYKVAGRLAVRAPLSLDL